MKQYCPNCSGKMKKESDGLRCTKCKGFIDMQCGKFYDYVQKPFMPLKTNFDRITENEGVLAEFLVENDKQEGYYGDYYNNYITEQSCYDREEAKQSIIEWLQKECEG